MDESCPNNLPIPPNLLVGREDELKTARKLLLSDQTHLLNLTGPPAVGKTRLALATAQTTLQAFPDGVWFVDLATLQDPALVRSKIASLFGITGLQKETTLNTLAAYLRRRRLQHEVDSDAVVRGRRTRDRCKRGDGTTKISKA